MALLAFPELFHLQCLGGMRDMPRDYHYPSQSSEVDCLMKVMLTQRLLLAALIQESMEPCAPH